VQELNVNGQAVHDSLPRGGSACSLRLSGRVLVARLPSGDMLKLDLRDAELERSGPDGREFVYASVVAGGPTFITRDVALYQATMAAWPHGSAPARAAKRERRISPTQWLVMIIMASVVCMVIGAVLLVGPLARTALRVIPRSVDARLGQDAYAYALLHLGGPGVGIRDEPEIHEPVQTVLDRLTQAIPHNPFDLRVTVCESPVRNAVALPGGQLLITTGMLTLLDSPDELAAVLAHEINHVLSRHSMEMTVRVSGLRFLINVVSGGHVAAGMATSVWGAVSVMGSSRAKEGEADMQAVHLLLAAGVDPGALVTMLGKLSAAEPHLPSTSETEAKLFEKLRSHPHIADRVQATQDEIDRSPKAVTQALGIDYPALLQAIRRRAPQRAPADAWRNVLPN
jgi:predicted Zn-dependent protease